MFAELARRPAAATAPAGFIAGDEGRPLFTWHHVPPADARRGAGVVLCPPLGYEYMSAYQTWRTLADSIAGLGFDVLRFDYDGTGDSSGDYADRDRVEAWLRSIGHAVSAVQAISGSPHVALVGFRAGALLALHAAGRTCVDRLVLWSPFPSGAAYVRELKAFASLSRQDHAEAEDFGDELNAAGHALAGDAVAALSALTMEAVAAPPAGDVLLVHRDDRRTDPAIALRLEQLGCRVTSVQPVGTEAMLVPPQRAAVPDQVIRAIVDWLADWRVSPSARQRPATRGLRCELRLPDGGAERIVRFGEGDRLFGVLGVPAKPQPDAPSIIFFNTAVEHHIGPHRMYVPLGREFIAAGHVVLRFDLGGIGDSQPPPGADLNVSYPSHMLDDAKAAIAFVKKAAPGRPVIAVGLCSGAWMAYRAAAEHLPVAAIAAINPPLYLLERDRGASWLAQRAEARRYGQSMRVPGKWAKALRGRASFASFALVAGGVLSRRVANRLGGAFSDTVPEGLASDLVGIARHGVRALFVFSAHSDGLAYFEAHAGPALRRAFVREALKSVVVEGAGHSFRPRAAQRRLRDLLRTFIQRSG
jgi:alpha-beta hydrolase superfamily lysophospholipase